MARRIACLLLLTFATLQLLAVTALAQSPTPTPGETTTAPSEGSDAEGVLRGTLRARGDAVAGVTITATSGNVEASTVTGDDGTWEISVPPGDYEVVLDVETLPEGIGLPEGASDTRTATVAAGEARAVLFRVDTGEAAVGVSSAQRLANLAVQGLKLGSIIAITSVGLSLIFGVTGIVNFAHGELVTLGAVVAFVLHVSDGARQMPLILAAVIAVAIGGVAGGALELGLFGPLRRRKTGLVAMLVITIGLSFLARHTIQLLFGTAPRQYFDYAVQRDPLTIGPVSLAPRDWTVILIALIVLTAVGLLLQKTRLGTAMRAVSDNADLAASSGIDVKRVTLAVWVTGGALAALGGVLQGLTTSVITFDMGFALLLLMFAGVIVGGIGTAYGAMVGGIIVGFASEVSTFWFSVDLKLVFAFLVLIAVLLVRPQGLLGQAERIG
ncbi:MAG: branched-chain amino acid ABC transporter permease [Nitriliruptorales bacterium]|nr:branched-chain amino acid ABC transporter permease [Nitriliruptorales bacterium]